ncbi:MAG: hypothetical protein EHM40_05835 [Chloroflexi bacterium]|nr:MAG: hypothetical protein EHM40_05835 [Chloroflexota bacterium]
MFRSSKFFVVLLVLVLATSAFAFAATNTVPGTYAGEGEEVISGYEVLTVDYNLNAGNPSNIDSVDLTLDAAASDVKIGLVNGGTIYDCTGAGTSWNCDTTAVVQATVSAANQLRVIAVD